MALSQDRSGPGGRNLTPSLPKGGGRPQGPKVTLPQREVGWRRGEGSPEGFSDTSKTSRPGRLPAGEGQRERRGEDRQGDLRVGGGCPPFRALPPWPTLPPGPPPFHQHLFNRNIKGPGPAAAPPFASI